MTTRIEKDGWIVSGDSREDLELGIEAVQRALGRAPTNGQIAQKPVNKIVSGLKKPLAGVDPTAARQLATAIAFLKAIQDAGDDGILGDGLVAATKSKSGKALGSVIASVNKFVTKAGCKPEQIFSSQRTSLGNRWTRKAKLGEVIEKLEVGDS